MAGGAITMSGGDGGSGGDAGSGGVAEPGGSGGDGGNGGTFVVGAPVDFNQAVDLSGGAGGAGGDTPLASKGFGGSGGNGGRLTVRDSLNLSSSVNLSGGLGGFSGTISRMGNGGNGGTLGVETGGTLSIQPGGVIDLRKGGSHDSAIPGGAEGKLELNGGTLEVASSSALDTAFAGGEGRLDFLSGKISLTATDPGGLTLGNPNGKLESALGISGGSMTLGANREIEVMTGLNFSDDFFLAGGSLVVNADFDGSTPGFNFIRGDLTIRGGTLSGLTGVPGNSRVTADEVLVNVSPSFLIDTAATLRTTRVSGGNLLNAGTFAPGLSPAITVVDGDYHQTATGVLEMEIGGLAAGSEYDRLVVTGSTTLDAGSMLDVILIDGFSPANGDGFQLFEWTSPSGTFGTVNLPDISAGGLSWDTTNLYSGGSLLVIPEPGTGLFVAIGVLLLGLRRPRRR